MTTLPCTCRPACSAAAARTSSTENVAAMGTWSRPAAASRAICSMAPGGGVGTVRGRDAVHDGGDRRHAGVRYAELACHRDRVRAVQVDGRGDAVGGQFAESVGQALAIGDRLGPRATHQQRVGRAGIDDGERCRRGAPRDGQGGSDTVVEAIRRAVDVASPCRCDRVRARPRSRRRFWRRRRRTPGRRPRTGHRHLRRPRPRRPRSRSRTRTAGSTQSEPPWQRRRS